MQHTGWATLLGVLISLGAPKMVGAFDIKGIELDRAYSDAQIIAKLGRDLGGYGDIKFGNAIVCGAMCSGETRIGSSTWHVSVFRNKDGTVGNLRGHFDSPNFSEIDGLLREKFGAPTNVSHQAMRNGFGVTYDNIIETWQSKNGEVIELDRYIDSQSGSLSLQSAKSLAEAAARRKAYAADGKI
jgi:hypothetical protein